MADEKPAPGGDLGALLRGAGDVAGLAADLRAAPARRSPGAGARSAIARRARGRAPSATRPSASAMTSATPQAAAKRVRVEPPGRCARAVGARRRQERERHERARRGRPRRPGSSAPRRAPEARLERRGQRADPEHERKRERDRAIGADAAVAHDLELAFPGRAAAEAVGDVGEPVLMQRAGRGDERRRRERALKSAGRPSRAVSARMSAPTNPTAAPATGAAQAMRLMSSGARLAAQQRQAGEKAQARGDVARARARPRRASVRTVKRPQKHDDRHHPDRRQSRIRRCPIGGQARAPPPRRRRAASGSGC